MAGIRIEGGTTGNVAEVSNGSVHVVTSQSNTLAGYSTTLFEIDPGFITGQRYRESPYVSKMKRLSTGVDTLLASYYFTATSQDTGNFLYRSATMTMTQSAGFLNINNGLTVGTSTGTSLQTWKYFTLQGDFTLAAESAFAVTSNTIPANQFFEWGLFASPATPNSPPTDGIFFRITGVGLTGVLTFNGVETETAVLTNTINLNQIYRYKIIVNRHTVSFWRDDILLGQIDTPSTQHIPFLSTSLPLTAMMRNSNALTSSSQIRFGMQQVTLKDLHTSKPWGHQMAGQGKCYQGQSGDTQGQLASWANATAPTATVLVNTSSAFTGLGGIAQVTVTQTAGTDGIIFSYQNPIGSLTQPPKVLYVTGVTISDALSVALATNPLLWVYGIAYGHTAISLATTESGSFVTGTTKSPRRIPIGTTAYPTAAAVGSVGNGPVSATFNSPIVVNPGEFFQIIAKTITTAPSAGALIVTAGIDHYFE